LFEVAEAGQPAQEKKAETPEERTAVAEAPSTAMDRTAFRKFLSKHFSLTEIGLLAYDLGVEIDDLEGSGKPAKIISLITYFERRDRYQELVDLAVTMQSDPDR
jgi:hypothetical protein